MIEPLFIWEWPREMGAVLDGDIVRLESSFPMPVCEINDGKTLQDLWVDFQFKDGKTVHDLCMVTEDAGNGMVRAKFVPHPKGPYPLRHIENYRCVSTMTELFKE